MSCRSNLDLFLFDDSLRLDGRLGGVLIGTDEAGRGPSAGGVFAAAVCFKEEALDGEAFGRLPLELLALNDSKKLSSKKREELYDVIKKVSYFSVKSVDVRTIERINILQASLLAMRLAVEEVMLQVGGGSCGGSFLTLVDGNRKIPNFQFEQKTLTKGDSKSASIAAASILAKVERDRYMNELHFSYPHYSWAKNKGYLTKEHASAIKKHGACDLHRVSFLKNLYQSSS
ncbi:ribonuclease HII [Candidatus Gastranaerophilus sp. (ex Termes propinquus)]|nr:ribonuclease HII [Candidatus Gastranaerophilus sp. (ex Termes propinquus)]